MFLFVLQPSLRDPLMIWLDNHQKMKGFLIRWLQCILLHCLMNVIEKPKLAVRVLLEEYIRSFPQATRKIHIWLDPPSLVLYCSSMHSTDYFRGLLLKQYIRLDPPSLVLSTYLVQILVVQIVVCARQYTNCCNNGVHWCCRWWWQWCLCWYQG